MYKTPSQEGVLSVMREIGGKQQICLTGGKDFGKKMKQIISVKKVISPEVEENIEAENQIAKKLLVL